MEDSEHKLNPGRDYLRAKGYDVTLEVTYKRTRRVRALDIQQAEEFALKRETDYAPKYFSSSKQVSITSVEVMETKEAELDGPS